VAEPWEDERITTFGLLLEAVSALRCRMDESSVPEAWFEVLLRLARSGGRLRMAELAAQVRLSTSGLTRLVDRVEAAGLVAREACPTDRRGANAVLTPAGEELLRRELPSHLDAIQRNIVEPMGNDLASLEELLRRLRDAAASC
jgi:DNA-binding MarR family transcriptional regulator